MLVVGEDLPDELDELARPGGPRGTAPLARRRTSTGALLVIAHDPDPDERLAIALAARDRGALVNMVDDIPNCDVAMPAVVRRGDLLLAIGTGRSVARRRDASCDGGSRPSTAPSGASSCGWSGRSARRPSRTSRICRVRGERWRAALDPDEAAGLVREGRAEELHERLRARLRRRSRRERPRRAWWERARAIPSSSP